MDNIAPLDKANAARLAGALGRRYRFGGRGIMTLGEFLVSTDLLHRHCYVRHYARHKRDGCYAELSTPAHEYSVWYLDENGRELGMDIPKMVYDSYAGVLPDRA